YPLQVESERRVVFPHKGEQAFAAGEPRAGGTDELFASVLALAGENAEATHLALGEAEPGADHAVFLQEEVNRARAPGLLTGLPFPERRTFDGADIGGHRLVIELIDAHEVAFGARPKGDLGQVSGTAAV